MHAVIIINPVCQFELSTIVNIKFIKLKYEKKERSNVERGRFLLFGINYNLGNVSYKPCLVDLEC